jgi:hypothetical protein
MQYVKKALYVEVLCIEAQILLVLPFTITVPQSHFLILLLEMNTKIEICKRSKTSVPVVSRSVKPEIPNES